ncbi:L-lactate permease [Arthrobacter castelli]|uniref:L-lactate permease n=1 Tax=Arthrobacter castelli TaxID=271431 RepID=UPI000408244D|nr:L-lactate permease [Arthrobacter castelli]
MVEWSTALLASTPIVCACLLLGLGIRSSIAASAAVLTAVVVSALAFPISPASAAEVASSLGPVVIEVLLIILGGVLLGGLLRASGAQQVISEWVERACSNPQRAVLLVVLGITAFAESVTGFGLGVIVGIPILLHFGLSPTRAATVGLLGLTSGAWGSLAPGTLVAAELGNVSFRLLGTWSAVFNLPVLLVMSLTSLVIAFGFRRAVPYMPHAVGVSLLMWVVLIGFNYFISVPLAGVAATLTGIAATLLIARFRDGSRASFRGPIRRAVLPYSVLICGLLGTSLLLDAFDAGSLAEYAASPALWLLITCAVTPKLVGMPTRRLPRLFVEGLGTWWAIGYATGAFLVLGGILAASGMSSAMAGYAAQLGKPYLTLIPVIGGIGGFITGSNTGSAAMFSTSTVQAAEQLNSSRLVALAGQNAAASVTFMSAPPRVALAISVADGGSHRTTPFGTVFRPVVATNVAVVAVLGAAVYLLA